MARFDVFPTFHGADVRGGFLSHLSGHFERKKITMFKDTEIKSGSKISSEIVKAIRGSSVSIVLLSNNYASSSWCLDELVEIMKNRKYQGQIVIPVFYQVDPSHIRRHSGGFGRAFERTCEGKSEEEKLEWRNALTEVANIKGEHSQNWRNETEMLEKIVTDVSKKLVDFHEYHDILSIDTVFGSVYVSKKRISISYKRTIDESIVKERIFEFSWHKSFFEK